LIFSQDIAFSLFCKELELWTNCVRLCCVVLSNSRKEYLEISHTNYCSTNTK